MVLLAACDRGEGELGREVEPAQFPEVFSEARSIHLEESSSVLNVEPAVVVDPAGGFLIADSKESRIRHYDGMGRLTWQAGRRGSGPGEYLNLQAVARLPGGRVVAIEIQSRLTILSAVGDSVLETQNPQLRHMEDIAVLNDSTVLLSGKKTEAGAQIHLYNLRRQRAIHSFFAPFSSFANPLAASVAGFAKFDLRADTLAVTFAPSDTVYFYLLGGQRLPPMALPSARFRSVRHAPQSKNIEWFAHWDIVSDVFWLADGSIIVVYQSLHPEAGFARDYHLVRVRRDGRRSVEVFRAPRLLAVHPKGDTLYFQAIEAEVPNQWSVRLLSSAH